MKIRATLSPVFVCGGDELCYQGCSDIENNKLFTIALLLSEDYIISGEIFAQNCKIDCTDFAVTIEICRF